MVAASLAILVTNRLLPQDIADRDLWEEGTFWFTWLFTLVHAAVRSSWVKQARLSPAWAEQCWLIAALAILAVILNAMTTGDHLLRTIAEAYWPVAGVDLMLLCTAALTILIARKLRKRAASHLPTARNLETTDIDDIPEAHHA
ncbi:MAG: hypothetical protein ACK5HY_18345 [Parahaliea sp.]